MRTTFASEKSAAPTTDQHSSKDIGNNPIGIITDDSLFEQHQLLGEKIEDYVENHSTRTDIENAQRWGVIIGVFESMLTNVREIVK